MLWDESDSDGDDHSDSDSEDTELYEEIVWEGLRNKTIVVKNGDNTYRCPLSPGRKKQSYKYRELLAHATGVATGKKGPVKAGGHRAVMKYLLAELGDRPMIPQAERILYLDQVVPKRKGRATRLLAPWMGILVNIDNSRTNENGFRLAPGPAEIKEKFKGTALLTFRSDIRGLEDAQAFEHSFAATNRGRKAWWEEARSANRDLYGWQAAEKDLESNLGRLAKHIKNYCDVKTVKDMVQENERLNKQIVEDLVKIVDKKNDMVAASHTQFVTLQNMVADVEALRLKAEEEKRNMEAQHKRDLEEMILKAHKKEAAHNEIVMSRQVALTNKLRTLESRCEQMRDTETKLRLSKEAVQLQFEKEMENAQRLLKEASKKAELHAAMRCKQTVEQKELIQKHEGENMELELAVQKKKMELMQKQLLELEKHQVKGLLEMEKSEESNKDKIAELEAELEMNQVMVNALSTKERTANEELEEARKVALDLLKTYGDENTVGIKYAGSIKKAPWIAACKKKNHPDGYQVAASKMISEWEQRLKDPKYHPFTTVDVGGDNWKGKLKTIGGGFRTVQRVINKNDEFLKELKMKLGMEVLQTVTTAVMEMEEYNASGRFVVEVAWDFRKNQRVLLKDVLLHFKELLESKRWKFGAKKKRVAEY
uniref:Factor of DNA methylation 1-5/IDN2 domain-containing protein n=1 Tax=Physcomitrium patens TaxID=3218 RepID=A0A7I4CCJ2_PHYPA